MKKLLFVLVFLAVFAGAGYWFWSFGSVQETEPRYIELSIQQSGVQVKKPGSEEWQQVTTGMRIEKGWSIKTNETGLATVRFYGQGESRLDRNSEMTIGEGTTCDYEGTRLNAEVTLNAGRIWSRVLRLMDIESSYSIRTSEVVATVRGTAFDLEKTSSGVVAVAVAQSAVSVAPTTSPYHSTKIVGEGMVATFGLTGTSTAERVISDEERSSGWYVSNDMADQAFLSEEIDRRKQSLELLKGVRPDSPLSGVAALSERVHLALSSDQAKNVLLEQYLSRRLYHIIQLVKDGKTGLAAQELTRIENDLQAQLEAKKNGTNVDYIRSAVFRMSLLLDNADPNDALYPFKQRVERLFETLSTSSEVSLFYSRLVAFDARLDEAVRLIDNKKFDDAKTTLDGVKSGVENVRRDSAVLVPTLSDAYRYVFESKLSALEVRERILRTKIEALLHPMAPISASSTEMIGSAQGATITQTEIDGQIVSISLVATSNSIDIGQRTELSVKGKKKDGTEVDLTAFAVFSSVQYVGRLNGPSYLATGVGKDEITARYERASLPLESKITITTKGEVKLVDLVITSSKGSELAFGQKTVLTATARYNNGVTKNVSDQTTFVIVSGGGVIQKGVFSNDGPLSAQTSIAGTFKDAELTSIGSIKINVGK